LPRISIESSGSDLAVRLGGDEFLVLLPECTLEQLELVLERLGSLQVDWQGHKILRTFSAGWRCVALGDRPEELLPKLIRFLCEQTCEQGSKSIRALIGYRIDPTLRRANSPALSLHRTSSQNSVQRYNSLFLTSPLARGRI
jgi:hypothetical protein